MTKQSIRTGLLTALVAMMMTAPAWAIDLIAAKTQGLVGETPAGLIESVNAPGTPDVQELVKTTNEGRMKIYTDTATAQHVPVGQVQAISGKTLIEKTPSGQYVKTTAGTWVKK